MASKGTGIYKDEESFEVAIMTYSPSSAAQYTFIPLFSLVCQPEIHTKHVSYHFLSEAAARYRSDPGSSSDSR